MRGTPVAALYGMEITGVQHIRLPQATVWEALNDATVLRAAIPGCEQLTRTAENRYAVSIVSAIGAAATRFDGTLTLFRLRPPDGCAISFEGAGQGAGSVLGQADITLVSQHLGTTLSYRADMQVAGPLENAGPRLLEEAARRMVEGFFARFKAAVEPAAPGPAAGEQRVTEAPGGVWLAPLWSFMGGFVIALVAIVIDAFYLS